MGVSWSEAQGTDERQEDLQQTSGINVPHLGRFVLPVLVIAVRSLILNYAQTVDPQVFDSAMSGYLSSLAECLWEF